MPSDILQSFGKAVREAREKTGLSQEALAHEAGVHRTYVSQIERGIGNATITKLFELSKPLGISPSEIVKATEDSV